MSLTTPILKQVPTFDAREPFLFEFVVLQGGDEVQGNSLYINIPAIGNSAPYTAVFPIGTSKSIEGLPDDPYYRYNNLLPANSLTNGYYYSAYLTTSYLNSNLHSANSNTIAFYCLKAPTFEFSNLDASGGNVVTSSNFTVYVEYNQESQQSDPVDPLAYYTITLYNQNQKVLKSSKTLFTNSVSIPYTGSYNFTGLVNGETYYVRATGVTVNNAVVETPMVEFTVSYTVPESEDVIFTLENDCENGCIRYSLNSTQEEIVGQYSAIRIKRKRADEYDWLTIAEKKIQTVEDLQMQGVDYLAASEQEYIYAWIPVINDAEGSYITQSIYSRFHSVFVCDSTHAYKFDTSVSYGSSNQIQDIGIFSPLNRQYPVYVANATTNYQTGSFKGRILEYTENGELSRVGMVAKKNALLDFLTNKKPKILKDFNGNIWLLFVIDNPSINYDPNWGNGMMMLGFNYAEFGDAHNVEDLQEALMEVV